MSINRATQSPVCPSPACRPILGSIQTPSSQQSTVFDLDRLIFDVFGQKLGSSTGAVNRC